VTESGEPHEATTTWQDPDGLEWRVTYYLKRLAGRVECIGVRIDSYPEPRPLRATVLRELPMARLLDEARREEVSRLDRLDDLGRRLGGRRYTTEDLKRVADKWQQRWEEGSDSPTRDTAQALGLRYNQAAKMVERCRKQGLLPRTAPGIARGFPERKQGR